MEKFSLISILVSLGLGNLVLNSLRNIILVKEIVVFNKLLIKFIRRLIIVVLKIILLLKIFVFLLIIRFILICFVSII